ncbi:hypothetical protein JI739_18270 [Ramlibacter sp. AW1]|uniref:Transmembrane protein n=1 Tax=Ramlibacter aurantiacus TaxID=2801330 RepID=A0A937D351_9BURK|nr:hypothetical protein [Ramlibacter aurantiacus]MBL0422299.1 hypothetical protein [Ramlibacter aurantiacus]
MNQPVIYEEKTANDRLVMHVLYGMHTVAWLSMGTLAVIALIVNYIKRGDEQDPGYIAHHSYMIATFWWTIFWLVLTSPLYLLFIVPGMAAWTIVGLWYLYRCIRGWLRFTNGTLP